MNRHIRGFLTLLMTAFAALIFAGCGVTAGGGYQVDGLIEGVVSGNAYLIKETRLGGEDIDTVEIDDQGRFTLVGRVEEPGMYGIRINRERQTIPVFLDNTSIEIKGALSSLGQSTVEGSSHHTALMAYVDDLRGYDAVDQDLKNQYNELVRLAQSDTTGVSQRVAEIVENLNVNVTAKAQLMESFPVEHADEPVGAYVAWMNFRNRVYEREGSNFEEVLSALESSSPESQYTQWIRETVSSVQQSEVGAVAPDFTLPDFEGNAVSLTDYRGKYLLIDFWAGWCGPCRRENPNLVKAYEQFAGDQFEILGVSLDNQKAYWEAAVAQDELTWPQVSDLKKWNSPVVGLYSIKGIPANFLLDPEGVIIAKNLRGPALESKLAEIFPDAAHGG